MKTTIIGIAELDVVRAPDKICTLSLGSCCGVVLYDRVKKIGGMIHIMLPSVNTATDPTNKAKFADTGILLLLTRMAAAGAQRQGLTAKLAGGAHMFAQNYIASNILKVGENNVAVCKEVLKKLNIPILAEDVLGTFGRTIVFDPETGKLLVKTVGKSEKEI